MFTCILLFYFVKNKIKKWQKTENEWSKVTFFLLSFDYWVLTCKKKKRSSKWPIFLLPSTIRCCLIASDNYCPPSIWEKEEDVFKRTKSGEDRRIPQETRPKPQPSIISNPLMARQTNEFKVRTGRRTILQKLDRGGFQLEVVTGTWIQISQQTKKNQPKSEDANWKLNKVTWPY